MSFVWVVSEEHEGARGPDNWVDSVWDNEEDAKQRVEVIRERLPGSEVDVMAYELNVPDGNEIIGPWVDAT